MAPRTGWGQTFFMDAIITTPDGRELRTLAEARDYVLSLPAAEQRKPHWQRAAGSLLKAAELGPAFALFATAGMTRALQADQPPAPLKQKKRLRIGKRLPRKD